MRVWIMMAALALGAKQTNAADSDFDRAVAAVEARMAAVDAIDNVIPGRAIVAVEAGREPVINVRGGTQAEGGQAVTEDTPFYIASMTKAFVGLMAVRLDDEGIMPLDLTLAQLFPDMKVAGVDTRSITMRRLLNHQLGFSASPLNIRTAYTDMVPVDEYARIVSSSSEPADANFQYSNLGYLLYAAALERRTGRSWKAWLNETVLGPLNMRHSSARSSDLGKVTSGNERVGDAWRRVPPKRDSIMHAAGGLFVSPADMARFLSAEAGGSSSIPARTVAMAQSSGVKLDLSDGPMTCTGYAFGWMRCSAFGESFLNHSGEYAGQRAVMVVVPSRRIGFAAMFNSDSMTGGLGEQLAQLFLMNLAGKANGQPSASAFAARYREIAEDYRIRRTKREEEARQKPEWGGWRWKPGAQELIEYAGSYRHPAYGELRISVAGDGLEARFNGTDLALDPAIKDRFGAALPAYSDLMPLRFDRGAKGAILTATLDDIRFERIRQ